MACLHLGIVDACLYHVRCERPLPALPCRTACQHSASDAPLPHPPGLPALRPLKPRGERTVVAIAVRPISVCPLPGGRWELTVCVCVCVAVARKPVAPSGYVGVPSRVPRCQGEAASVRLRRRLTVQLPCGRGHRRGTGSGFVVRSARWTIPHRSAQASPHSRADHAASTSATAAQGPAASTDRAS